MFHPSSPPQLTAFPSLAITDHHIPRIAQTTIRRSSFGDRYGSKRSTTMAVPVIVGRETRQFHDHLMDSKDSGRGAVVSIREVAEVAEGYAGLNMEEGKVTEGSRSEPLIEMMDVESDHKGDVTTVHSLSWLLDTYTTLIHAEIAPIGHPTSQAFRQIVTTRTTKTLSNPRPVSNSAKLSTRAKKSPGRLVRHDTWPLPSRRHSTGTWGGAGLLGVAETDLERLKRERRAARELSKRVKQSLLGEIDSWEVQAGASAEDVGYAGYAESESDENGVARGWSDDGFRPISDEEWGEERDYGGVPADLNELMVVDGESMVSWLNWTESDEKVQNVSGWQASGWTPTESVATINFSSDGDTLDASFLHLGEPGKQSSTITADFIAHDPPLSPEQRRMSTPFSPELSPDPGPCAFDMQDSSTKFQPPRAHDMSIPSFSPRKRQHAETSSILATDNRSTGNATDNHSDTQDTQDTHIKKKPFSRRETV